MVIAHTGIPQVIPSASLWLKCTKPDSVPVVAVPVFHDSSACWKHDSDTQSTVAELKSESSEICLVCSRQIYRNKTMFEK